MDRSLQSKYQPAPNLIHDRKTVPSFRPDLATRKLLQLLKDGRADAWIFLVHCENETLTVEIRQSMKAQRTRKLREGA